MYLYLDVIQIRMNDTLQGDGKFNRILRLKKLKK